ncbi:MAG: hypothetical protein ABSB89_03590 [Candidatus Bathyarchaeia archaeon]|jgi:hypothetical protein
MKSQVELDGIVYGRLVDDLSKLESAPLLRITLVEAVKLGELIGFIREFVPEAFFMFVVHRVFKKSFKPVPEAPIASWEDRMQKGFREQGSVTGEYDTGWELINPAVFEGLPFGTNPKDLLASLKEKHQFLLQTLKKMRKGTFPQLCCIILSPHWEKMEKIAVKDAKSKKSCWIPAKKFIAEFRTESNSQGIEVLTFQGFCNKYQKEILDKDFRYEWSEYQRKLYLDFMKHFPMMAYSLCHDDYLAYKDYQNKAEVDLNDGKYPEAIAMDCKALEHVLRVYSFMKTMEEAPEKELGWFYQSLKADIMKEFGEIYCKDLELILSYRPHAVHAKIIKQEPTEIHAQEVHDRVNLFCKTFFHRKWNLRI